MENQHEFLVQSNNALRGKIVEINNALQTYLETKPQMSEGQQMIFINKIIQSTKGIK